MDIIIVPLLQVLLILIGFYMNIIVISVIIDWLCIFGILKTTNKYVFLIRAFLHRITEPVYDKIRRVIPPLGNVDLSPFILLLILYFFQGAIVRLVLKF